MQSRTKLLSSALSFFVALALVAGTQTPAEAKRPARTDCGFCDEGGISETSHNFGAEGALYSCEPNSCHFGAQIGYCGEWHYTC